MPIFRERLLSNMYVLDIERKHGSKNNKEPSKTARLSNGIRILDHSVTGENFAI
jgi:hypothetical protein